MLLCVADIPIPAPPGDDGASSPGYPGEEMMQIA